MLSGSVVRRLGWPIVDYPSPVQLLGLTGPALARISLIPCRRVLVSGIYFIYYLVSDIIALHVLGKPSEVV